MAVRKYYRELILASTTSAVDWTIKEGDSFSIKRISINIGVAATSAGSITITLDSAEGAAYDTVLRTIDPVATAATSVVLEDIEGLANGDAIVVAYANPDSRTITGTATTEL